MSPADQRGATTVRALFAAIAGVLAFVVLVGLTSTDPLKLVAGAVLALVAAVLVP